ncbi:MAG: glycerophosphodiester phosphodiesterase [Chloroflexi bacterium]|nr:glycerophosphodiester phosphodiesterase [Chloroflexota bacterium]
MLVFGHRGARGEAPENTLAGFAYARRLGVAAFELDVRLSADEQLVVIHDTTVDRTTDASGPVSAFTAAELARLDARAGFAGWPAPVGVPRLVDVLDVYAGAVCFAIEVKTDAPERLERVCALLAAAIERYRLLGNVTVTSFDPVALEIMRRLAADVPRAYIGAYDAPAFLETARRLGCAQADVPLARGSAAVVRAAQAHGLRVIGWQGNTRDDLEKLVTWGVDGLTSDYPSRALAFLRERPHLSGR